MTKEEYHTFMSEVLELITQSNYTVKTALADTLPDFVNLLKKANTITQIVDKNGVTELLASTGKLCDGLCIAIQTIVEAYRYSHHKEEKDIAKKLKTQLRQFEGIHLLPPNIKITKIYQLLREREASKELYKQLHLTAFCNDLAAAAEIYDKLYGVHASVQPNKAPPATRKDTRSKIDEAYFRIKNSIEVATLVYGIAPYKNFIIELNILIYKARGKIKQRERALFRKDPDAKQAILLMKQKRRRV
jgi:hypothetical protein